MNEKRLESYEANYQNTQDKLNTLMIFYSFIGIFVVPVIEFLVHEKTGLIFKLIFAVFIIFIAISIYYLIKFLIPVNVAYLNAPRIYYEDKEN